MWWTHCEFCDHELNPHEEKHGVCRSCVDAILNADNPFKDPTIYEDPEAEPPISLNLQYGKPYMDHQY